ncbi:MAG: hypothetical protein L0Z62_42245 [Gemmataceae bacterium]|nr:hypothetical protein [Gemmataceae bacterium]
MNPADAAKQEPIFKWETMREVGPHTLPFKEPIHGTIFEVELTGGPKVMVFRADDRQFYFCHGLTFGGKEAPGGAVSPFSGKDVRTIVENHYRLVDPESGAVAGDILVWRGPGGETPHSAILTDPVVPSGKTHLDYRSQLRSKSGKLPEATVTLERLVDGPESYGESYNVYRRK